MLINNSIKLIKNNVNNKRKSSCILILNSAIQLWTIDFIIVWLQCFRLLSKAGDFAADQASGGAPGAQAHQAAHQALKRISRRTWRPGTSSHEIRHAGIFISLMGFSSINAQCILLLDIDMTQ